MDRSGTADLGDMSMPSATSSGPPGSGHRVDASSKGDPAVGGERRTPGGQRGLLLSLLVLTLLTVSGSTVTLLARRADDRSATFLPPPAPPIPGLTPAPRASVGTDTPERDAPGQDATERTASASASPAATPSTSQATGVRTVSGPVDGLRVATFDLASSTSTINVRTADIGDDLYRISASAATRQQPRATVTDGTVRLTLLRTGKGGRGEVRVVLNAALRWSLQISASVSSGVFDLRNGNLESVRLGGDAARIELRTPAVDGTLPIRITGGINRFRVDTIEATPARARIRGGAGKVQLGRRVTNGVAPGASLTTGSGFNAAEDRIDIDAVAGIGTVTVDSA
jgi:hypothetical protein